MPEAARSDGGDGLAVNAIGGLATLVAEIAQNGTPARKPSTGRSAEREP
jgi:hypothetical protein